MRTEPRVALLEERSTKRGHPPLSRTRKLLIGSTAAVYAAVVVGVLTTSWLVKLDWQVMLFRPYKQWPQFHALLDVVVVLGQRGPTAVIVLAWLSWRSWKHRDLRPLLVLGLALLLLNITVGAVKYGLGRLGPHYATTSGSAELFAGGDIFPSGHTANAVVTWGVLAYLATKHRRTGAVITAVFAFTVGMTTIYLGTHWVTDVIAGWTAGILIMLILPLLEPCVAWADLRLRLLWARMRSLRGTAPLPSPIAARGPGLVAQRGAPDDDSDYARPTVGAVTAVRPSASGATAVVDTRLHHPARAHAPRHDRSPATPPPGTRRPRPDQRNSRTAPLGPR
ncbi:phosphatase PAP2 family protein [Wenjunlia tyrosinilytica]|uniref:Membrane protein n=1 Tax=Wenjunlia tyrosinilytica TaxID=1544741 RepID=A0A918DZX3_9ACTN|nr:phosphatase PAP2 family protein [Wenjunlia tyrosinilytica]GGO95351.1 membrane protein [Wenjunlia tyrosinilytica]